MILERRKKVENTRQNQHASLGILSLPQKIPKHTLCNLQRMTTLTHILNHSTLQTNWVTRLCELELSSLSHYPVENTFLLIHDYASKNLMYSLLARVLVCLALTNSAIYIYIYIHTLQFIFCKIYFIYLYVNTYKYKYEYMYVNI